MIYPRSEIFGFDITSGDYNKELYNIIYKKKYPWWDIFNIRLNHDIKELQTKYKIKN